MYLYLGQETVINTAEIVGIFDLENTTISRHTKTYLTVAQKKGQIMEVSPELPKSFVVCNERDRRGRGRENSNTLVYLSQISPATLRKRTSFIRDISNI